MSTTELLRTPLHDWHVDHGGRMVDFAGWSMPVQYVSIAHEHQATRERVGLFDISHMGRLRFSGADAAGFLDGIVTRRVTDMKPGQVRYALVCNDEGGILDDVLVYRLASNGSSGDDAATHQLVVNASNRLKIVDWLNKHQHGNVTFSDNTTQTAMLAVQGPGAIDLMQPLVDRDLRAMRYYTSGPAIFGNAPILISRTGYTGEDGCEIICETSRALSIWERILEAGQSAGCRPAGLGARDTLRLEAAMPLYGHELSEEIDPFQAGLAFAVNLNGREFVGRGALERLSEDDSQPVRVGLQLDGRRVPRQGCPVLHDDEVVGEVTSGTFSLTLHRPIAMAYVRPTARALGTHLAVDIRGTQHPAIVVPLPFYERGKKD